MPIPRLRPRTATPSRKSSDPKRQQHSSSAYSERRVSRHPMANCFGETTGSKAHLPGRRACNELRKLRIEPHRQSGPRHMGLGVTHGKLTEMKNRSGQHGAGVAVPNTFDQMIERADTSRSDDRYAHRIGDSPRERNVEALSRAVAIHRREQDFASPERDNLARVVDGVETGRVAAAMGEYFPAIRFRRLRHF